VVDAAPAQTPPRPIPPGRWAVLLSSSDDLGLLSHAAYVRVAAVVAAVKDNRRRSVRPQPPSAVALWGLGPRTMAPDALRHAGRIGRYC
jgi:hypothetical protein